MRVDEKFLFRVRRDSLWFAPVLAFFAVYRLGYGWRVGVGLVGGAVLAITVLWLIERLVVLGTDPQREGARFWLMRLNWILLPLIAVVMYVYVSVLRLDGAALALGLAVPMVVGFLKCLGTAWGEWARGKPGDAGSGTESSETGVPRGR